MNCIFSLSVECLIGPFEALEAPTSRIILGGCRLHEQHRTVAAAVMAHGMYGMFRFRFSRFSPGMMPHTTLCTGSDAAPRDCVYITRAPSNEAACKCCFKASQPTVRSSGDIFVHSENAHKSHGPRQFRCCWADMTPPGATSCDFLHQPPLAVCHRVWADFTTGGSR